MRPMTNKIIKDHLILNSFKSN